MSAVEEVTVEPHDPDDRVAMGLPHQVITRLPADLAEVYRSLASRAPEELVPIAEGVAEPLARRYAAGTLLGLLGDPRIRPDDPVMVEVPGGSTTIGLPVSSVDAVVRAWARRGVRRDWILKECPRHAVDVRPFRMMRYPVTNYEYLLFLRDTGRWPAPTSWSFGAYPQERANHPVWTVTERDAEQYAGWLSRRTTRSFRLPTEVEWEHAATGGDPREFPWGDAFDEDAANTVEAGPLATTPVGVYPRGRSPFGVDDMAGNVEEFVADDYARYPGGTTVDDDLTTGRSRYRVTRGGSFSRFGDLARCRRRHGQYQRFMYAVGFRLVEELR
ncbi:formylglycine-generating enzyme family protein [Amycolatopsis sp. NPDC059021]|uniref:formylglycine-generating enzyme family protein n=1 Tax=Amycolatopsis sp. NPDC059021 TaxID=3346704 RepID=UPI00366B7145